MPMIPELIKYNDQFNPNMLGKRKNKERVKILDMISKPLYSMDNERQQTDIKDFFFNQNKDISN